ncbi:TlyA family RNA methyltransferase [Microbacterium schleiferi]|uniref:TlyA family RNA methyltransferase n=1 Tax=Microbacterium schleiferi TaxID=69362 RepID=A0A7S8MYA1_9MICO|nr:TlyA family RNA methyltransferase [Microbacterium schleiferi]QPE05439.1 TlyA family RNA methyltransferase [Microbacterium schleiferi]
MTPRLDAELAARGLARSRTHAARLIAAGSVSVDGQGVVKPSAPVDAASVIEVAAADHYVSRGAHKLVAALDAFTVDVAGKPALDLGASTGGFTQVLRERDATPVIAVDVGHGQLAPTISADPAVVSVEGFNVRYMDADTLRSASGVDQQPQVVVGDLSFISLGHVLPAICRVAAADADIILLVKPQFEVGRTGIREGIVTDAALRSEAVMGVLWSAWDLGLRTAGVISSPIVGTHGNLEYLVHLAALRGSNPTEWISTVNQLTGAR